MPFVIESFYSSNDGFMVLGKVSILKQGCAYCPTERPPIIFQPMHCYSLGIDMLHKSELLDCQLLFLQPGTWPACQGPHILASVYWPDALRQGTVRRTHHYFTHIRTLTHTHTVVHNAHIHIPILRHGLFSFFHTFFEAQILNSDSLLFFTQLFICQQALPSLPSRGIGAKAECLPSVHNHYASH